MTAAMSGQDTGSPVSEDYGPRGNAFSGRVKGVQIALAEASESADHKVSPEEAMRVAMARPIVTVPVRQLPRRPLSRPRRRGALFRAPFGCESVEHIPLW